MSNINWDKLRNEMVDDIVALIKPHVAERWESAEIDEDARERAPSGYPTWTPRKKNPRGILREGSLLSNRRPV